MKIYKRICDKCYFQDKLEIEATHRFTFGGSKTDFCQKHSNEAMKFKDVMKFTEWLYNREN